MKDQTRELLIQDLLEQLENEDWTVRYSAARILGSIDAEEAIEEILAKLKREDNRDVRRKIVQAIEEIDLDVAIPHLINAMNNDSSMMVRYTAARALGRMGAIQALPEIRKRIPKETNPESIFWFHVALARLERDKKGQGIQTIKKMKRKNLLTDKQLIIFSKLKKELKEKRRNK